jgi:stage II sporulation SpoE-like protein
VERGFFVLDAHLRSGGGDLIDLLAVDGSRALAVLEIDRGGEEELLRRSLEHQTWAGSQIYFLRRLYGPERIHPFRTPRAILLARHFSRSFLRKICELPVPLTPLVYRLEPEGETNLLRLRPAGGIPPPLKEILGAFGEDSDPPPAVRRLSPEVLAAGIQSNLKPHLCPPIQGYDIAGINLPCRAVGGDTYDFLPRPRERLWMVIGDVAGKGHSAAMIMSHFQSMLHGLARLDRPAFQLVERLNDILARALPVNEFISFLLLELEPREGTLRFVNAGHNPPFLLRASGKVDRLQGSGPVLGVVPGYLYPVHETRLVEGDTLLLYTDGATESRSPSQEEFGEERLLQCLSQVRSFPSAAGLSKLEQNILGFCGSAPRHDDITLVLIRRLPAA